MNKIIKIITIVATSLISTSVALAQTLAHPANCAELELITPDAKAAGMADIGASTSPDVFSQHWNVAKYAFVKDTMAVGLSYTMWMPMVDFTNLFYLAGYYKMGKQTLSASIRYKVGGSSAKLQQNQDFVYNELSPNQFSIDFGYSRSFGNYFSVGLATRFISLPKAEAIGNNLYAPTRTGALAFDLGLYFAYPLRDKKDEIAVGLSIKNVGTKVAVNDDLKEFLPQTMYLGSRYSISLESKDVLTLAVEVTKPLVPRRQENKGVIEGLFSSFGNNIYDWSISLGGEYFYQQKIAARVGYHFGDTDYKNGAGSYLSVGGGLKLWQNMMFDLSYMITTSGVSTMSNNVRASLQYTF